WSFQVGVRFVGNSHESCLRCRTRGLTVRVGLAGLWLAVFGSFSAMPRAAARARISRQILAGPTLARHPPTHTGESSAPPPLTFRATFPRFEGDLAALFNDLLCYFTRAGFQQLEGPRIARRRDLAE